MSANAGENGRAETLRVILIGVGGATCSGKTTLAKHLRQCIPDSFIIHQDDFAPPQELVPVHPEYGVQDWDDAPGALDWPRLRAFLRHVKATGAVPPDHRSHDHLNEQKEVPLEGAVFRRWRSVFEGLKSEAAAKGERIVWGLVDGFLLYWDQDVIDALDVRLFLRVSHDVLRARRHERHGYHTAEGALWRDPPHYFEQIVYPAYVRAHSRIFEDGDVERGSPIPAVDGGVAGLVLVDAERTSMEDVFETACRAAVGVVDAERVKEVSSEEGGR